MRETQRLPIEFVWVCPLSGLTAAGIMAVVFTLGFYLFNLLGETTFIIIWTMSYMAFMLAYFFTIAINLYNLEKANRTGEKFILIKLTPFTLGQNLLRLLPFQRK